MIDKNIIKLINTLNEKEWEYQIINGVFSMILGNKEIVFHVEEEEKAKKLIEIIENW